MATRPPSTQSAPQKGEADASTDEVTKPKKSGKKIVFVILLLLILAGGGGAAWWFFGMDNGDKNEKGAKMEKASAPIFLPLEQFTVNLQPEGGEHYLQVAVTLQVASNDDVEQIKLYMPQIRSRILFLLTSKKGSEIATLDGKKKLSDEIRTQVNMPVASGVKPINVVNVFFTSFVIQ